MLLFPAFNDDFEKHFSDEESCLNYLIRIRWPKGFVCPKCGDKKGAWKTNRGLWTCAACKRQTSITSGTIFHRTKLPMTVWFRLIWEVCMDRRGISVVRLRRRLGLGSDQTAWLAFQKFRKTLMHPPRIRFSGNVEVDTFCWGGITPKREGRGALALNDVTIAFALEQNRKGKRVYLKMIESTFQQELYDFITETVEPNSPIISDVLGSFRGIEIRGYRNQLVESRQLKHMSDIASEVKTWICQFRHGMVTPSNLPLYLAEFTRHYNQSNFLCVGPHNLFRSFVEGCVVEPPMPLHQIKSPR